MKTKGSKFGGGNWNNLGLRSIFLLYLFFFVSGFLCLSRFSQQRGVLMPRKAGKLQVENTTFLPQPHGVSGEDSLQIIPFQILSWKPRALYFPNFATAEQCQSIIEMAESKLKPSTLALRKGETVENTKGIRTSSGMFISSSEDKTGILAEIEAKIAKASLIPTSHGESFNILRYQTGQSYHCHYDAFRPAEYRPQKSQRLASFLLYLSDVEQGGETVFPFENERNMDGSYDFEQCIGLRVKPKRGDGLLFYSLFSHGTIDPTSLHGSCPVIKGEKWVATKWIRDREYNE